MPPAIRRTTDIRSRTIVCLLKGIFQNAFGFAAIFVALCCDICRPDLLFELELDALHAGIP